MKSVALIYRGSRLSNPYIQRIADLYIRKGYNLQEFSWQKAESKKLIKSPNQHIFYLNLRDGLISMFGLPLYFIFLFINMKQEKWDIIHAVNEDVAVLSFLLNRDSTKIVDIRDGIVERINTSSFLLKKSAGFIRDIVLGRSSLVVVPDENRLSIINNNKNHFLIMENTPDPIEASHPVDKLGNGPIQVLFSGSLSKRRGAFTLLEVLKRNSNIHCILAGSFDSPELEAMFLNTGTCNYIGQLPHNELLKVASRVDAIYAFYAPDTMNNLYASPSKLYEGMMLGVPIIINSECVISQWVIRNGIGFISAYSDVEKLCDILTNIRSLKYDKEKIVQLYLENYQWSIMERRFVNYLNQQIDYFPDKPTLSP